ncbi:MAG: MBL fold metallo-hydrolase [Firmicutes bacterium]|nr:MBL fold metallo-hydrolase [Bacillota bacterium]
MVLTILGCQGAYPAEHGGNSCYLVSDGKQNVLLDMGSGAIAALHESGIVPGAVILSHLHGDHTSDAGVYRYFLNMNKRRCDLWMPDDGSPERSVLNVAPYNVNRITDDTSAVYGEMIFTFFPVTHPGQCYGVTIMSGGKKLVYSGDSRMCQSLAENAAGADILLLDCAVPAKNHTDATPHMNTSEGVALWKSSGARALIITHLMPGMPVDQNEAAGAIIAHRGMEIEI